MKKILVACECSQVVTSAFRAAGADAWSCDLEPSYGLLPQYHIQGDVRLLLDGSISWDLVVAHPPCTYLCRVSGQWLNKQVGRWDKLFEAREFFLFFTKLGIPTCIENPIPLRAAQLPPPSQFVNPCDFGHPYSKRTYLWLYGLPPLLPMRGYCLNANSWVLHCSGRSKRRSRFWEGIAEAMAAQWLPLV